MVSADAIFKSGGLVDSVRCRTSNENIMAVTTFVTTYEVNERPHSLIIVDHWRVQSINTTVQFYSATVAK